MKKTMVTMFAVLAAVSMAKADDSKVDFDGNHGASVRLAEMVNAADSYQISQPACSQPMPVPSVDAEAVAKKTFAVSVGIKNVDNGEISGKDMVCSSSEGELSCSDKDTGQLISKEDLPAVLVQEWWTRRSAPGFVATRSPYTTCSSGHEFDCEDYCRHWTTSSSDSFSGIGTGGASSGVSVHTECTDWSYKCSDQGAGTCAGPTTPPSHGFHHPDEKSMEVNATEKKMFIVSVGVKNVNNGDISGKDMVCSSSEGELSCSDKGTGQLIGKEDLPAVLVQEWWTRRSAPGFVATRSPYTTCSSGHEFDCEDYCRKWVVTSTSSGYDAGENGVGIDHGSHSECADWSYRCTDQGAGTCAGPTTPPSHGFHHPDEK
jgi:hypothetical protein